jgi:O-antigen/teichoic acid export membrane protein
MPSVRKNFAATLYSLLTTSGGQLLLVPIFLACWGAQRYGWWLVLYTIPAYFTFSDAGMSNSLGNALTIAYQRSKFAEAQQMLNATWKFQFLSWIVVFILFVGGLFFLPMQSWLALNGMERAQFVGCSILLCFFALLSLQFGIFTAIFRAAGRFDQFVRLNSHGRVVEIVVTILVLLFGGGMIGVAIGILCVKAAIFFVCWRMHKTLLGGIKLSWQDAPWSAFRSLLPSGLAFMTAPLGMAFVNQGSTLLVNHQIGPVAVVTLNVCRQLARQYQSLMNALMTALHPELTRMYASRNLRRMRELYSTSIAIVFWTAVPALFALAFMGPVVIAFWTKSAAVVSGAIVAWCGMEAIMASLGQNAALPSYAANRPIAVCVSFLICNAIGLFAAAVLSKEGALVVIPTCFAVTNVIFTCYAFYLGVRVVEGSMSVIVRNAISPAVLWKTIRSVLRHPAVVGGVEPV